MCALLVVDNGSVYTKNLLDFLSDNKIEFEVNPPEKINFSKLGKFDFIILSGRRKNDKKMNAINSKLINHAIMKKKALLGICYGAEILALTLGGTIRKTPAVYKGTEQVTMLKKNPLCDGQIDVFESHNYEISRLGEAFLVLAESKNCRYEIIQYNNAKIFGTQFHPEMSNDGKTLIKNFLSL